MRNIKILIVAFIQSGKYFIPAKKGDEWIQIGGDCGAPGFDSSGHYLSR